MVFGVFVDERINFLFRRVVIEVDVVNVIAVEWSVVQVADVVAGIFYVISQIFVAVATTTMVVVV